MGGNKVLRILKLCKKFRAKSSSNIKADICNIF